MKTLETSGEQPPKLEAVLTCENIGDIFESNLVYYYKLFENGKFIGFSMEGIPEGFTLREQP